MHPCPKLDRAGQPRGTLVLVVSILALGHDQGGVLHPEVQAVAVARLRVTLAGTRRIAVEPAEKKGQVLVRIVLGPQARCRKRVGGPAAREVGREDGRPTEGAVDELVRIARDVEFSISRQLSQANTELVA